MHAFSFYIKFTHQMTYFWSFIKNYLLMIMLFIIYFIDTLITKVNDTYKGFIITNINGQKHQQEGQNIKEIPFQKQVPQQKINSKNEIKIKIPKSYKQIQNKIQKIKKLLIILISLTFLFAIIILQPYGKNSSQNSSQSSSQNTQYPETFNQFKAQEEEHKQGNQQYDDYQQQRLKDPQQIPKIFLSKQKNQIIQIGQQNLISMIKKKYFCNKQEIEEKQQYIFQKANQVIKEIQKIQTQEIINEQTIYKEQILNEKAFINDSDVFYGEQPSFRSFQELIKLEEEKQILQKLIKLQLFGCMRPYMTSPRKKSTLSEDLSFQNLWGKVFGYAYQELSQWEVLRRTFADRELWQSSGNFLTVGTTTQVRVQELVQIALFVPTVIEFELPYDLPHNQVIDLIMEREDGKLLKTTTTHTIYRRIGLISINVTPRQKRAKKPIIRRFVCQQIECNQFYTLLRIQTKYPLRLYSLKVWSVDII